MKKSGGGSGTLYWYMTPGIVAESDLTGNLKSEYVFFNGERVARRDFDPSTHAPIGVFYYFSDHLKTASVITDSGGNIKAESDYYPWGGELQFVNNDSNHYKFTGKERDTESGLDYFGARYYSNGLGRFITPDWAAKAVDVPYAEFSDPQSLNLYSYVRNIPTSKVDADGHVALVDDAAVATLVVGTIAVLAVAAYTSQPENQRNFNNAVNSAMSTVKGWFHKNPSNTPANGVNAKNPPSTPTNGVSAPTSQTLPTTGVSAPTSQTLPAAGVKTGPSTLKNTPRSDLPRDKAGNYLPHPDAQGPHTVIGTRVGSDGVPYRQGATFDEKGNFTGRTDVTDHGRADHVDPHFHPADGPNSVKPGPGERIKP